LLGITNPFVGLVLSLEHSFLLRWQVAYRQAKQL